MSELREGSLLQKYMGYHDECWSRFGEKSLVLMKVGEFYELYAVINDGISVGPPLYEIADILNIPVLKKNKNIHQIDYDNHLMIGWPESVHTMKTGILLNHGYTLNETGMDLNISS